MAEPHSRMNSDEPRQRGLKRTAARASAGARLVLGVLRTLRGLVWRIVQVPLAIIIVFEEWGWRPLVELLGRLARLRPLAMAEAAVARLPPYPALAVFVLPSLLLLPLKLLALWLIAHGHVLMASLLFVGAKLVGTALVARIFMLTRPALMQLGWFARIYNVIMPWKEAITAQVRASWAWRYGRVVKARVKQAAKSLVLRWRPIVEPTVKWLRGMLGG